MRVLYVAMTRARDRLIMTYTDKSPEKELAKIARCLEPCGAKLLAGEAKCPGQWVLMEAMCRTEAGQLFALAEAQPDCTRARPMPWKIRYVSQPVEETDGVALPQAVTPNRMPEGTVQTLQRHLSFRYSHPEAAKTPSKLTATQIKGRAKDQEAAEATRPAPGNRVWRTMEQSNGGGKAYGTAMHTLMQYLRFDRCACREGLEEEIARLTKNGFFTPEEAASLDREGILAFFATELGQKLIAGETLREFKFTILEDASGYGSGLEGEQILLQGVVDCALVEPDGITIVDFKTDYVTEKTMPQLAERYRPQVQVYAKALSRVYELPVKAKYLWLFHLRKLTNV
jgi:ATP-dependent helicase/nuclease subunit A